MLLSLSVPGSIVALSSLMGVNPIRSLISLVVAGSLSYGRQSLIKQHVDIRGFTTSLTSPQRATSGIEGSGKLALV